MVDLGQKLKRIRRLRGLSTTQLAEKAGLSQSYISKLETGAKESPNLATIGKLATALGVKEEYFLYETAIMPQDAIDGLPDDMVEWLNRRDVLPYLNLAKELHGEKISPEKAQKLVNLIRTFMDNEK